MNFHRLLVRHYLRAQIFPLSENFNRRNVCKIRVTVQEDLVEKFEKDELKHRNHPGKIKIGNVNVPKQIVEAINKAIGDFPIKKLLSDGKTLNQYMASRHPPPEIADVHKKIQEITKELDEKYPMPEESELLEADLEKRKYARQQKLKKTLKERTFAWKPISYGQYEALVYAVGRSAQEYAVLMRIFNEIRTREPSFKPRSFIDFGSGVGSAMWAASEFWRDTIFEYLNVDSSREMNDLSELILRAGNENQQPTLKNVYYRQFLPSLDTKYDLVVSAYSLFELPSAKDRKEVIRNLWRKCDGYLVIVEEGTRKASEIINEVRTVVMKDAEHVGHVFAPCPHNLTCPRLATETDRTPCNFQVSHEPLGLGEKNTGQRSTRYSYVVLKKGSRNEKSGSWPRIVRPTLVRSKHTVCRMCTSKGTLQEIIFTQSKHGRDAYRCARSSEWGDRLPIEVGEEWQSDRPRRKKITKVESES